MNEIRALPVTSEATVCKYCGGKIKFAFKKAYNSDDLRPHRCDKPKVKIFTKEEIAELNKLRGYK